MSNEMGVDQTQWRALSRVGLAEWLLWAALLGGGSAFLFFNIGIFGEIFSGGTIGSFLYLALMMVAIIAISQSYMAAQFVKSEIQLATKQVKQLVAGTEIAEFVQSADEGLFKNHIANLYQIMRSDPEISQDNLIVLMQDKLVARNRQSQLFASVLVTIGLIGTIAGLIGMTAAMKVSLQGFDSDATEEFVSNLVTEGGALSGLDIAFYTTLVGATLGGVVLRILAGIVEKNITLLVSHVAELSEVHVLPSLRRMGRELEANGYYSRKVG